MRHVCYNSIQDFNEQFGFAPLVSVGTYTTRWVKLIFCSVLNINTPLIFSEECFIQSKTKKALL